MKTQTSLPKYLIIIALLMGLAVGMAGCADYVGVGVSHVGYDAAYYAADYQPVYTGYYYGGGPWWGASYYYSGNKVVVKDVDKYVNVNRNVYSGGHRFVGRRAGRERAVATTHPAIARPTMTHAAIARPATARPAIAHPVAAHRTVRPVRR